MNKDRESKAMNNQFIEDIKRNHNGEPNMNENKKYLKEGVLPDQPVTARYKVIKWLASTPDDLSVPEGAEWILKQNNYSCPMSLCKKNCHSQNISEKKHEKLRFPSSKLKSEKINTNVCKVFFFLIFYFIN